MGFWIRLKSLLGAGASTGDAPAVAEPPDDEDHGTDFDDDLRDDFEGFEPIELEITGVLDLHSFPPREVPDIVRDYLDAAAERGLTALRIIHGRGTGTQRRTVRTLLERDPRVLDYGDAPMEAGGWGATVVTLAGADGPEPADG